MTAPSDERTAHPFHMYDEMHAQPDVMRATLAADAEQREHLARELAGTHAISDTIVLPGFLLPSFSRRGRVTITGCGTAHHAALTGADWFRRITQGALDVRAVQAFEFANYDPPVPRMRDVLLALSHSGQPLAMLAAAERARDEGQFTVAVTGKPDSDLAQRCDETLRTTDASVIAGAYTISHMTMLTVLADLARRTAEHLRSSRETAENLEDDIAAFPDLVAAALAQESEIRARVDALPEINQVVIGGGGPNWAAALEGALKIREASYLSATGFEMEEILHGPWASFDERTVMFLIAPPGSPSRDRALVILPVMRQIGVTTIAIGSSDDHELAQAADATLELPASAEMMSVIPATAMLQQITYWLAMRHGGNPDRIRRDQPLYGKARSMYTR